MTMTDTILFVKETQTCRYVLYIATPRLCGEPGFRSRLDAREEAYIRCREVVSPDEYAHADRSLPETEQPFSMPRRTSTKPVIAAAPADGSKGQEGLSGSGGHKDALRAALERMLKQGKLKTGEVLVETVGEGDEAEEVVIEFVDLFSNPDEADELDMDIFGAGEDEHEHDGGDGDRVRARGRGTAGAHMLPIEEILRAAGVDVKGPRQARQRGEGESRTREQGHGREGHNGGAEHEDGGDQDDQGRGRSKQRQNTRDEL